MLEDLESIEKESLEPGTTEVGRTEADQEEVYCKAIIRKNVAPEVVDLQWLQTLFIH